MNLRASVALLLAAINRVFQTFSSYLFFSFTHFEPTDKALRLVHHIRRLCRSVEPSSRLRSMDVSSRRKRDDHSADPPPTTTKTDDEDGPSCELCETVDFVTLFTSTRRKKIPLGPLSHVFSCLGCSFCRLVAESMTKEDAYLARSGQFQLVLTKIPLPSREYLRQSGIEMLYRLEVWAKNKRK